MRYFVTLVVCLLFIWAASCSPVVTEQADTTSTDTELAATNPASSAEPDEFRDQRLQMVEKTIARRGVISEKVLQAMREVPRHKFTPPEYLDQAYADHPLPIGYGQTISQPYIVAWMTELLNLESGDKVLEIGSGSGYQAAVLAALGGVEVYSIEIVPELAASAAERLDSLGYKVELKQGDGYYGWPEAAPFDAIIVTAAPDHLPAPLVAQLAPGGRLVIPIGPPGSYQSLWKFELDENGKLKAYNMGGVSFVPFTGEGIQQATVAPTP
jgi:protein-L-isoaspartate(D-aspartate) O-methyltransferase